MQNHIKTWSFVLKICIFFTFVSQLDANNGRRYDVDNEAIKLFGEDFKAVLRKFRRTGDYLKILRDKMDEMDQYFQEMSLQVLHYVHTTMIKKIDDIYLLRTHPKEPTKPTTPREFHNSFKNRRQDDSEEVTPDPHGFDNDQEVNKEAIKALDNYKVFNYELTVPERNSFRDMGFEYAGHLIHTLIEHMGPVDPETKITRQPGGGDDAKNTHTTTQHPDRHEVTTTPNLRTARGHLIGGKTDGFKFRVPYSKSKTEPYY